jgi:hypothetical protein
VKKTPWMLAVAAALALGLAAAEAQTPPPAQEQEPSLADLARKARERKQKSGARVVTNDDLPQTGGVSTVGAEPPAPQPEATAAAVKEGEAAAAAVPAGEESEEAKEARTKLEEMEKGEKAYGSQMERIRKLLEDPDLSDFRRELYEDSLRNAENNLQQLREERKAAETNLKSKQEAKPKPKQ